MIVPEKNLRSARRRPAPKKQRDARHTTRNRILAILLLTVVAIAGWSAWVLFQIHRTGEKDEAGPADAIAVFGAAEYHGRPSAVLKARLQHTLELYRSGLAPVIITTGGEDDLSHTEGGVGRDYLTREGVPATAIIAETLSESTQEAVTQLAEIARSRNFHTIIVVSDASHLFRVKQMCKAQGLMVLTSPRAWRAVPWDTRLERQLHELGSYTAWRLHLSNLYD